MLLIFQWSTIKSERSRLKKLLVTSSFNHEIEPISISMMNNRGNEMKNATSFNLMRNFRIWKVGLIKSTICDSKSVYLCLHEVDTLYCNIGSYSNIRLMRMNGSKGLVSLTLPLSESRRRYWKDRNISNRKYSFIKNLWNSGRLGHRLLEIWLLFYSDNAQCLA